MFPALLSILAPALGTLIDRLIPDRAAAEKVKQEIEAKLAEADIKAQEAQVEVNKIEAGSRSVFVAGWRPALGWLGVVSLSYSLILYNLACWALVLFHVQALPPAPPDVSYIMSIVVGMLGIGGLRTYEKKAGLTK